MGLLASDIGRRDTPDIVERSIQGLTGLGTLPEVALEVLRLAHDPDARPDDFHEVINLDPALCVRVLKVVNSAFYGLSRKVDSIRHAVVLLGPNAVKDIAIASSVHKMFIGCRAREVFDPAQLWLHSVAAAAAAREIARRTDAASPNEAFVAGLIHDIGLVVELQTCRAGFDEVLQRVAEDPQLPFRIAERGVLGATHEEFGAALCRHWSLPPHLECAAGFHHSPDQSPPENRAIATVVHLADVIAGQIGAGFTRTIETRDIDSADTEQLGLSTRDIEQLAEDLPEAIQDAHRVFADSAGE